MRSLPRAGKLNSVHSARSRFFGCHPGFRRDDSQKADRAQGALLQQRLHACTDRFPPTQDFPYQIFRHRPILRANATAHPVSSPAWSAEMACKAAGFTLIETMVVLAIAAIVIALGFPSFNGALQRQRVSTTMHLLSADMAMARSTALMRRSQVVVCPRDATTGCSDTQDWSRGWLVFTDPDSNRQPDADSDILRASDPPASDLLYLPATRRFLRYQADGRSAHSNLSVHVCVDGAQVGKVVVNNLGRVRSERPRAGTPCPRS